MRVKIWGVRGSLPRSEAPHDVKQKLVHLLGEFQNSGDSITPEEFLQKFPVGKHEGFGGNTSCVQVDSDQGSLLIDGGSGIKDAGQQLLSGPLGKGQGEAHVLMTHFHWDHLIGLPFFTPIFIPGNDIHFYGVQDDLESCIRSMFRKPFFPVEFDQLGSNVHFHILEPRQSIELQGFSVTPYQLDHPDPCWGYRIEKDGKALAHCVDTELTRASREDLGLDLPLYQGADLMIFDAQYTLSEVLDKANWGHSVASFGLDLAVREKIKKVLFVHHDPYATNDKILEAETQTREYNHLIRTEAERIGEAFFEVEWEFAQEAIEIEL